MKTRNPTSAELGALCWADRLETTIDAALTTGRATPLRVVRRCIERGWLREMDEPVVMVDGDGFTLGTAQVAAVLVLFAGRVVHATHTSFSAWRSLLERAWQAGDLFGLEVAR